MREGMCIFVVQFFYESLHSSRVRAWQALVKRLQIHSDYVADPNSAVLSCVWCVVGTAHFCKFAFWRALAVLSRGARARALHPPSPCRLTRPRTRAHAHTRIRKCLFLQNVIGACVRKRLFHPVCLKWSVWYHVSASSEPTLASCGTAFAIAN